MGLIHTAPDKKYPFLLITGPKTTHCDTHGLPDKEEIAILEDILSATSNFITGVTPKVLAGTVTKNCQRLNYYYVKDTTGIRTALNRLYSRSFKNYTWVISLKPDPEWTTYRTFLYPDEPTLNWMENEKIMATMLSQGDSLKAPRNINFYFNFRSDTDRTQFINFAKVKGYKIADPSGASTPGAPYPLQIATFNNVKTEIINNLTTELKAAATQYHGSYNTWSAPYKEK
jgi:hypothetical protein